MGSKEGAVYSELAEVRPIYVSGVANAYLERGNIHVSYFQETRLGDGTVDRIIVLRLIISEAAVMDGRAVVNFEIAANRHTSGAMVGARTT